MNFDPEAPLVGFWREFSPGNQYSFLELSPQGFFTASDGCNSLQGTWEGSSDGEFAAEANGVMTLIGCNTVSVPDAVYRATTATVSENGQLLTLAEGDDELLTLERRSEPVSDLVGFWVGPSSSTEVSLIEFREDSSWRARAACSEFSGTWELSPTDGTRDLAMFLGGDPQILRLTQDPEATVAWCGDDGSAPFPLAFDTDNWFRMANGRLYFAPHTETPPTTAITDLVVFLPSDLPATVGAVFSRS